ncbi:unnamed protein product [Echinostoma caproni]|uniref:DNA topoisomerase 2-binding protein 1 n=1 Tax=Echinostoma caproni TaxID=27848 RepID=A0A183AXV7_9TREM|nr:unnamed protein product [Echinostoma caproni]
MDKDKYEIVFINDYATALLTAAFDAVSAYENLSAKRLDAAEVLNRYPTKPSKRTCFVFCRFEGECFEHLRSLGAAIYGPQIILHYIRENQPLPRVSHPLYSTALMRAVATVTSVTGSEREYLLSSIQMLHGQASRDLFDGVNVVITPKVGSKKYLVGSSRGVNMLLPSWITEAWKLSAIQDPIDMMLPTFMDRFRVPIFAQLVICVSGLSAEERKEVSDLVVKHGGRYSGMMKIGETTHLIIKHPSGLKYAHAKKWKIQIVSVNWLTDSVSKGYALDEMDYRVPETHENSSTPLCENNRRSLSFDNLSMISHAINSTTRIDETRSDARSVDSFIHRQSTAPVERPILADCLIQLIECTREEHTKFSSLVKELGGRLCTDLQDRVTEPLTHAVVGSSNSTKLNAATMEKDVFYVKGSWLIACQEAHKRVSETEHLANSPESDETEEQTLAADGELDDRSKQTMDTEDLQLINQYFGAGGLADMDDFNRENTVRQQNVTKAGTQVASETRQLCEALVSDMDATVQVRTGCFSGYVFYLHDQVPSSDRMEVIESIRDAGGQITDSSLVASFIVAPFFIQNKPPSSAECTLVTVNWIGHCIAASSICWDDLKCEKAFTPLVRSASLPLDGCVISLSGFVGRDRTLLTRYSQALGAVVQDYFLCKAIPSRNLAASTHLVAAKLEGRKCPAAKQWGLPVVNRNWLYACADQWKLVDTAAYPVTDPNAPPETCVTNKVSSTTVAPKDRRLTEIQQNAQLPTTASINSMKSTPPIKMSTPTIQVPASSKSAAETLCTPDWVHNHSDRTTDVSTSLRDSFGQPCRPSPPLSEQVARCLKKAVVRTAALPKRKLDLSGEFRFGRNRFNVPVCLQQCWF